MQQVRLNKTTSSVQPSPTESPHLIMTTEQGNFNYSYYYYYYLCQGILLLATIFVHYYCVAFALSTHE